MAPTTLKPDQPATVGYVSHDSLVRVDQRVKEIARRQDALRQARRAAERLKAATS